MDIRRYPTFYKPEYCQMVFDSLVNGKSLEMFAEEVEVSRITIYTWKKRYPEFNKAVNEGLLAKLQKRITNI